MTAYDEEQEAQAAEYVLGTLDAEERAQVEALMRLNAAYAARVRAWERRLGELSALVDPVEPPEAVWGRIKAAIAAETALPPAPAEPAAPPPANDNAAGFARSARRWRAAALGSGALAAGLAALIVVGAVAPERLPDPLRPGLPVAAPGRFVAVLQKEAGAPAFILTVDVASRTLTARRVGAEQLAGQSYELWLVSDRFPGPRSLGTIGAGAFTPRPTLAAYDPATIHDATYAVSLEPEGGSPTGAPTGPVLWSGKLIEAVPPPR